MYRDLILHYHTEDPDPYNLSLCLTRLPLSRYLEHVQTIKTTNIASSEHEGLNQYSVLVLDQLLPKLRDDSLTKFEFDELTHPTLEQLKFLWQHQKRLRNLQLMFKTHFPMVSDLKDLKYSLRSLKFITELDLDLESAVVDSVVCPLLEILDLSHLQKLRLGCFPHPSSGRSSPLKPSKTLFSDCFPATLTHLTLRFISFFDNYLQLDDYPFLTHLDLRWCDKSQDLFAGYSRPTLVSLCLVEYSSFHMAGLADMLHRFQGLESLTICIARLLEDAEMVQFLDAVDRHKDTLKYLLFNHNGTPTGREPALFNAKLCDVIKTCKNLSQLGISLCKTNIIDVCKVGNLYFEPCQEHRRLTYQVGIT